MLYGKRDFGGTDFPDRRFCLKRLSETGLSPVAKESSHSRTLTVLFLTVLLILGVSWDAVVFAAQRSDTKVRSTTANFKQPEKVTFSSLDDDLHGDRPTMLDGYVFRPDGNGPFPAIVALHGCSGLFMRSGRLNARFADWGSRLSDLGYVVLFPDSFHSRGVSEMCTRKDRSGFSPYKERLRDAKGALLWLQTQPFVKKDRIGLMGWSNGGTTLLAAIYKSDSLPQAADSGDFRVAIAFYPSCTSFSKSPHWRPRIPLAILIGEADDWTPAASCRSLVARAKEAGRIAEIVTFPNAYHDFDHPNLALKTRTGLAFTVNKDGTAKIGTNQGARAAAIELVPKILERYLKEN
jgi:dienelactone hydrolase